MTRLKAIIGIFTTGVLLASCAKNDILEEIADVGDFTANTYFLPISPIATNNTNVECQVDYWSIGDQFNSVSLMETTQDIYVMKTNFKDITYAYEVEIRTEYPDAIEYKSLNHDFTNWVPAKNSYSIKTNYSVPVAFKRVNNTQNNTTKVAYEGLLIEELSNRFFSDLTKNLTKTQLQTIIVTANALVDQGTFDSYFGEGGAKTPSGLVSIEEHLRQIGVAGLIGTNYSLSKQKRVALYFKVVNGYGTESNSVTRAFNVN